MDYSPINYRRMDWFFFDYGSKSWQELTLLDLSLGVDLGKKALVRGSYRGYLPSKEPLVFKKS